jgi:hypothetical protein
MLRVKCTCKYASTIMIYTQQDVNNKDDIFCVFLTVPSILQIGKKSKVVSVLN